MTLKSIGLLVAVGLSVTSCDPDDGWAGVDDYLTLPDTPHNYGIENTTNAQIQLGRVLFYDTQLSASNSVSCASCHKQSNAFGDNVAFSEGFDGRLTLRNTLPLVDSRRSAQFRDSATFVPRAGGLFWDGRQTAMEDAVIEPIFNHIEMGISDEKDLTKKLEKLPYYAPLFKAAFATPHVNMWGIRTSLANFVASMRSTSSRFKLSEKSRATLSDSELLGQSLFIKKYNCSSCHQGQLGLMTPTTYQSQAEFANIGLSATSSDRGLWQTTGLSKDDGLFRVPSLNNVGLTAPYMHDGSLATLEEVIDHYSNAIEPHRNLDKRLKNTSGSPMRMEISEEEKKAIIAFLLTFTDYTIAKDPWLSDPFKAKSN